jgi:hypothetical protein
MDSFSGPSSSNIAGLTSAASIARVSGPLDDQIGAQNNAIGSLHQTIEILVSRLSSVLLPESSLKEGASQAGTPQPVRSTTVERLAGNCRGIEVATERLNSVLNRLEV